MNSKHYLYAYCVAARMKFNGKLTEVLYKDQTTVIQQSLTLQNSQQCIHNVLFNYGQHQPLNSHTGPISPKKYWMKWQFSHNILWHYWQTVPLLPQITCAPLRLLGLPLICIQCTNTEGLQQHVLHSSNIWLPFQAKDSIRIPPCLHCTLT